MNYEVKASFIAEDNNESSIIQILGSGLERIFQLELSELLMNLTMPDYTNPYDEMYPIYEETADSDIKIIVNTEDEALNIIIEPIDEEYEGFGYFYMLSINKIDNIFLDGIDLELLDILGYALKYTNLNIQDIYKAANKDI